MNELTAATKTFQASPEQKEILHAVCYKPDNLIIQACAGSGKTTTLKLVCEVLDPHMRILAVCFNKNTAEEFGKKLPRNVDSRTLHSVGMRAVMAWSRCHGKERPKVENSKAAAILDDECDYFLECGWTEPQVNGFKKDLNSLVDRVRETMTDPDNPVRVRAIAEQFGLDVTEEAIKHLPILLKIHRAERSALSYADMIDHPVHFNLPLPGYDVILIDEAQDLNPLQLELIRRLANVMGARIIAVGDKRQAIYAWRGADSKSMDRIKDLFRCEEYPLSVCYRCSRAVVLSAQQVVGKECIQAAEGAVRGAVMEYAVDKLSDNLDGLRDGDLVVCRTSAPLVAPCFEIIRDGRKAVIRGRDIGKGLLDLVKKIRKAKSVVDLESFVLMLKGYSLKEIDRLRKKKQLGALAVFEDKVDTLIVLTEICETLPELRTHIEDVFSNETEGVVFSTIHKAKGLESNTVMFLAPELIPHRMVLRSNDPELLLQEENLDYVARTRAKESLLFQSLEQKATKEGCR